MKTKIAQQKGVNPTSEHQNEQWALVALMGHGETAGRISKPSEFGGLLRVDVPIEDGYRTEYYGMPAIYSVKLVGEKIARAYCTRQPDAISYDAPIVTREQHLAAVDRLQQQNQDLGFTIRELEKRLTAVNALPAAEKPDECLI